MGKRTLLLISQIKTNADKSYPIPTLYKTILMTETEAGIEPNPTHKHKTAEFGI